MATVFFESASELATLTNTFEVAGVATDPTTVTLEITDPTGTMNSYTWAGGTVTRTGTGAFTKAIACPVAGTWSYEWIGTGAASDAVAGTWTVLGTALTQVYASVEELKSRIQITGTADDFELHAACFAASRAIEQRCERVFWRTLSSEVRTFEPTDPCLLRLPEFSDLVSVTSLKTDADGDGIYETTWSTSDYQLLPLNSTAGPEPHPYTSIRAVGSQRFPCAYRNTRTDRIQITGVFGWPSVPLAIKQAALILAADTYKLKDAPFGVQSFGEFGMRVGAVNRGAEAFLAPYRRNAILVA